MQYPPRGPQACADNRLSGPGRPAAISPVPLFLLPAGLVACLGVGHHGPAASRAEAEGSAA